MDALNPKWQFLATYAEVLHLDGTSAHHLEGALHQCAAALEVPLRVMASPTVLLLSIGPPQAPWTVMLPSQLGNLDIQRHEHVVSVANAVCRGELEVDAGLLALQHDLQPLYTRTTRFLAAITLCGAAAPLFGGGAFAILAAATGGALSAMVSELPLPTAIKTPVGAGLATTGALLSSSWLHADPTASLLGALLLLMPGLAATIAFTELATGNLLSGMARAASAGSTLVQVGLGMAIATSMLGEHVTTEVSIVPVPIGLAVLALAPAFTVVLGAQMRLAGWIAGIILLAWAGSTLGTEWLGAYAGAAVAAWLVGIAANLWSSRHRKPAAILAVPGLLLLVPGATGFQGVLSALTGDVVVGIDLMLQMGITSTALATGFLGAGIRQGQSTLRG